MNATSMARGFVGIVLVIAGVALGVWAGVWWALIGGIVQAVEAVKASPVDAWQLAFGLARVLCAGLIGTVTAIIAVFPGWAMLQGR